jgi:hypothetical protein
MSYFVLVFSTCDAVKVGQELRELLFSIPKIVEDQVRISSSCYEVGWGGGGGSFFLLP